MSPAHDWPGADIVFFDCDSTLSEVEGIDELATHCGVDVSGLTQAAMSGEVPLDQVFRQRLEQIAPTIQDLVWVVQRYREAEVAAASMVVKALQQLSIPCHVISGGLAPAVKPFALHLGFKPEQVHAVSFPLEEYNLVDAIDIACAHPLARDGGKPEVLTEVCGQLNLDPQRAMLIGDGASDLEAASMLGLFVGFGGVVTREQVHAEAPVFLTQPDLSAVALLAAGTQHASALEAINPTLYAAAKRQLDLLS